MRHPFVDLLRGLAVVLMIYTHSLQSWLAPPARHGPGYAVSAFVFALPSRLFLVLLGASFALRLNALAGRGLRERVRAGLLRAAELVGLGLLLRLHDWASKGFLDPARLWKVDILNCMGAATAVMVLGFTRRDGRPASRRALLCAAAVALLAPLTVHLRRPSWLPAPLAAYFFGPRPLAHFPLLPWLAFALLGLALGDGWARAGAQARPRRTMALAALAAAAVAGLATLLGHLVPPPAKAVLAVEADPLFLCASAAAVVLLGALCYEAARRWPGLVHRRSPLMLLGLASLPVYFVHLGICYGRLTARYQGRLGLQAAALGSLLVTLSMVALAAAWLRSRKWRRWRPVAKTPRAEIIEGP